MGIPRPYDRQPHWFRKMLDPGETIRVEGGTAYRRHSDLVEFSATNVPWVLASGICGGSTVSVDVSRMPRDTRYLVRLHFAELQPLAAGSRVFDVKVAGQEFLEDFDIIAAAGGPFTAIVKECTVQAVDRLTVELIPKKGEPVLNGVEILPQEPAPPE